MPDSGETQQEITFSYVVDAADWGETMMAATSEQMGQYEANSAKFDQVLTDIDSAEQANINMLTAIQSELSSAGLELPDIPARRSRYSR